MPSPVEARALVLGANSYLGQRIVGGRSSFIPVDIGRVNFESDLVKVRMSLEQAIDAYPDIPVLNCIGLRHGAATELALLNSDLPKTVAAVAEPTGTALVHIGSAAELLRPLQMSDEAFIDVPATARGYAASKVTGTEAVLDYRNGTVLRVYNLHGLVHQEHSGLHRMCLAIRAAMQSSPGEELIDTVRDYVHWRDVRAAVDSALKDPRPGVMEICSGVGISMADIACRLPSPWGEAVAHMLVPADLYSPVVGPPSGIDPHVLALELCEEVLECASS